MTHLLSHTVPAKPPARGLFLSFHGFKSHRRLCIHVNALFINILCISDNANIIVLSTLGKLWTRAAGKGFYSFIGKSFRGLNAVLRFRFK